MKEPFDYVNGDMNDFTSSSYSSCLHISQIAVKLPRIKLFGWWIGEEDAKLCVECGAFNVSFIKVK